MAKNTKNTLTSIRRGFELLIPVCLLILIVAGCASQQEIMAKQSIDRANDAYNQAKANPKVPANAPTPLAEAGGFLEEAKQARSSGERMRLGYLSEKKTQTAVTLSEGKELEKQREALKKEQTDLLNQKRVLEATLQAQSARAEAEQARRGAARDAAAAEKDRMEAQAKAREAEQAKREAETKAREAAQSTREAEAKVREAEQARLRTQEEAEKAEKARREAEAKAREAEQSKAEINQFLKELSELQGKMTERGITLTMGDVLFAFGKADLATGAVRNVDKLAGFLGKHPERKVLIEGHTDSVGSDEVNMTLSQKRADAVKEVLTVKGVSPDRILTKGYGKQFPVAGNDTESGRQMNRRVEVIILNEGVNPETALR
jgi:outer membrane protein OmpA-like peptidoglycan-associated protein